MVSFSFINCAHNLKQLIWNSVEIYVINIDIYFYHLLQCYLQTSSYTSMKNVLKLGTKKTLLVTGCGGL
jgi:hypothetical protein